MKKNKTGQGLVEYVLLVSLLALVTLASLTAVGGTISGGLFSNISSNLETANNSITGGD